MLIAQLTYMNYTKDATLSNEIGFLYRFFMKKYLFSFLFTACLSTSIFAQAPSVVAVAESVEGLVTVSQGNTLGNLVKDSTLVEGARVVSTSTGSTTIRFNNKCRIELTFNQAVTIDSSLECKALLASVQSTGAGAVAVAASSGAFVPVFAAGALAIGLIASQKSSGS